MKQLIKVGLCAVAFLLVMGGGFISKPVAVNAAAENMSLEGTIDLGSERPKFMCKETVTRPNGSSYSSSYGSSTNNSGSYCTSNGTSVRTACALNDVY